jgi:hypothetical protein
MGVFIMQRRNSATLFCKILVFFNDGRLNDDSKGEGEGCVGKGQ